MHQVGLILKGALFAAYSMRARVVQAIWWFSRILGWNIQFVNSYIKQIILKFPQIVFVPHWLSSINVSCEKCY